MKMKIKIIILFLFFIFLCLKYNILYIMNFNSEIDELNTQINNYYNYNNYTNNDHFDVLKNKYLNKIVNKINNLNNFFDSNFNTNFNVVIGGGYKRINPLHPLFIQTIKNRDLILLSKILLLYNELLKAETKSKTKTSEIPSVIIKKKDETPSIIIKKKDETPRIIIKKKDETPSFIIKKKDETPVIKIKIKTKLNIKIFNWNICWQCVAGEQKGSASDLGKLCQSNKCFNNIQKIINGLSSFDFITLQEALKWKELTQNISNTHESVHSKSNREDIVTLYNKNKYVVKEYVFGDISNTGGRPFQIIIFESKTISPETIIIINLHNGHYIKKSELERKISETFDKLKNINQLNASDVYVLAAGDFNDSGEKYFNNLQPFKYSSFKNFQNITVNTKSKIPPNTCCSQKEPPKTIYQRYGDYILFSNNFNIKQNNLIYQINNSNKVLASDHLAIYSELEIN